MSWTSPGSALLPLVPLLAIFGNALVVLAVYREKSLHSVTNLLIVSLAVSDFLVALCVMSFGVYVELNEFRWGLGQVLCNIYLAADVTCSTASILNLLAISLDRYIAISHPISYAQYGSRTGRAIATIGVVWGVSISVGFPILLGVNQMADQTCDLGNPYFNMISSLFSFFIPCSAMIVLYTIIFRRLRQRERARSLRLRLIKFPTPCYLEQDLQGKWALISSNEQIKFYWRLVFRLRPIQPIPIQAMIMMALLALLRAQSSWKLLCLPSPDPNYIRPIENFRKTSAPELKTCLRSVSAIGIKSSPSREELQRLQENLESMHTQYESNAAITLRSFGEELGELFPFIDSGNHSRKTSSSHSESLTVKDTLLAKKRSAREHRRSRRNTAMARVNSLKEGRQLTQRNGDLPKRVNIATSTTQDAIERNGAMHHLHPRIHIPIDKLNMSNGTSGNSLSECTISMKRTSAEMTLTENMKAYKNELWKRVTAGWKARPSRHLVKKATKQMKREQKATVTLAVVLGFISVLTIISYLAVFLFCWLPFFIMHLINSICAITSIRGEGCIPLTAMFFATWLGYVNSSLNPLIYTVFDQRFRNAFRNILLCGGRKK